MQLSYANCFCAVQTAGISANRRNAIATCICNFYPYQVISLILRRVAFESESSILELVCLKPAPLKSCSALRYFIIQCIKYFNEEAYTLSICTNYPSQIMAERTFNWRLVGVVGNANRIFTISACIQALITCFQPKLVGHYLFRLLNSFTLLAGFFWLLFVVWSTYELCLYTNGILPQSALIKSRLRQLIRKFLRLTIAITCGFVLLWAGFCKTTYSFPMPYHSTFQTVESDF
ncbi:hypothetical protein T09_5191 [Trichinella sp. T9]|nr:hypothetical protein T09_5191 [Trichinella sp. T9]